MKLSLKTEPEISRILDNRAKIVCSVCDTLIGTSVLVAVNSCNSLTYKEGFFTLH